MVIFISQIYIQPGVAFPFSQQFQQWLGKELTSIVRPSSVFIRKYGAEFNLIFRVSAKRDIRDVEVRGPTVYKKEKDVEYTLFLPYDVIPPDEDNLLTAASYILLGVIRVFESLETDVRELSERAASLLQRVRSDRTMISTDGQQSA